MPRQSLWARCFGWLLNPDVPAEPLVEDTFYRQIDVTIRDHREQRLLRSAETSLRTGRRNEALRAYYELLDIFMERDAFQEAASVLTALIRIDPYDPTTFEQFADVQDLLGRPKEAHAARQRAVVVRRRLKGPPALPEPKSPEDLPPEQATVLQPNHDQLDYQSNWPELEARSRSELISFAFLDTEAPTVGIPSPSSLSDPDATPFKHSSTRGYPGNLPPPVPDDNLPMPRVIPSGSYPPADDASSRPNPTRPRGLSFPSERSDAKPVRQTQAKIRTQPEPDPHGSAAVEEALRAAKRRREKVSAPPPPPPAENGSSSE